MLFLKCWDAFPYCELNEACEHSGACRNICIFSSCRRVFTLMLLFLDHSHLTVLTGLVPSFHASIVLRDTLGLVEVGTASDEVFCCGLSFSLTFLCRVSITLACRCAMRKIFV